MIVENPILHVYEIVKERANVILYSYMK